MWFGTSRSENESFETWWKPSFTTPSPPPLPPSVHSPSPPADNQPPALSLLLLLLCAFYSPPTFNFQLFSLLICRRTNFARPKVTLNVHKTAPKSFFLALYLNSRCYSFDVTCSWGIKHICYLFILITYTTGTGRQRQRSPPPKPAFSFLFPSPIIFSLSSLPSSSLPT